MILYVSDKISTHYFIMKTPNKRELQQTPINHSLNADLKILRRFKKMHRKIIFFPSYQNNFTALPSYDPLRFRPNLLEEKITE